jgi:hypothetical protein
MLLPIVLFLMPTTPPTFSVRTLHLKNISPSQLVARLHEAKFAQSLDKLIPDEPRKTVVLSGPTPIVEELVQVTQWLDIPTPQIELAVEIADSGSGKVLKRQLQVGNNQTGFVQATGKQRDYQLQVSAHLTQGGAVALFMTTLEQKQLSAKPLRQQGIGGIQLRRVPLGKTFELHAPTLRDSKKSPTFLLIRVTPRLKQ